MVQMAEDVIAQVNDMLSMLQDAKEVRFYTQHDADNQYKSQIFDEANDEAFSDLPDHFQSSHLSVRPSLL